VRRKPPESPVLADEKPAADAQPRADGTPTAAVALGVAVVLNLALVLVWLAGHKLGPVAKVDVTLYRHFLALNDHRSVDWLASAIVKLCNNPLYELLAAVPVTLALLRGRPWLAVAMVTLIVGAALTTVVLKHLAAGPLPGVHSAPLPPGSWPSGHTTATMALSCCFVAGAPRALRPLAIVIGAIVTTAMSVSVLVLGWHYATDALGGVLVGGLWAALVTAWLALVDRPIASNFGAL
jgi:membrane-associated phospholipid phosphatase